MRGFSNCRKPKYGLVLAIILMSSKLSFASHHFEAAAYIKDSRLALVDNYIFESQKKDYTSVVMTVNYDPQKNENGTFNPNAIYKMNLSFDKELKEGITFSFKFNKSKFTVYKSNITNFLPGYLGDEIGVGELGKISKLDGDIFAFAGIVEDPFYGNSIGLNSFRNDTNKGIYNKKVWEEFSNQNVFKNRIVGSIVLDIPNKILNKKTYSFFTTDLNEKGQWKQVQYSALPLFAHSLFSEDNIIKKIYDESRPSAEINHFTKTIVSSKILRNVTLANSQKYPVAYSDKISEMLIPDVITYEIGTKAKFSEEKINGRTLDDDAMSVMLTLIIGEKTDQKIDNTKKFKADFPYVIEHKFN